MGRLFIAVWPSPAVLTAVSSLDRPAEPGVRWVTEANWHITLRFIGEAEPDDVARRLAAIELPHATARLGPNVQRLGPRQLVVPASGVDELAAAVQSATSDIGERARHEFRGHLTVARTRPHVPSAILHVAIEASFSVDEVALVTSDLLPTGAEYSTVATFATTRS